jgi:hypothetical protein
MSTLIEKIDQDYLDAYKNHDAQQVSVLRLLKSAVKNAEIERKHPLSNEEIISIIQKEIKQGNEAILEYEKGNRQELVEKEKSEINILSAYLPKQLSDKELDKIISDTIKVLDEKERNRPGQIIGLVMSKIQGRAPGNLVSQLVLRKIKEKNSFIAS